MKILVADADQLFARLLKTKLEKWGHRVVMEHDGGAAYELIAKEPFRMVILDWDLPGMDGIELCRRVRKIQRPRYTYVIFYADLMDKDRVMACLEAGADDYLNKPLNTLELSLRIKAGKRLLNLEDMLREGAGVDLTTGVVNEASFREFFRVVMAETIRAESQGALIYVTVRNYVQASEEYGYNPTEAMMAGVAKLLRRVSRNSDLVARMSDDTFCILLQHTYWDKCLPVAEKIDTQSPSIAVVVEDGEISPIVEITAVNYPQNDLDHEQILDTSERIAYRQHTGGRASPPPAGDEAPSPAS
ncbi:MAG: response regulator [Alphaproteobacteria bacterium]|jgi:diguanylate cyclase (GGDEF)-like protein|nr:response regulator [Alphaproteobacteria bacterium]MDP6564131.1 response regulator [Alphaproteobacteria bacterium]MDP6815550.1 response regulator [Alphaproteobacteria bacterium]